MSNDDEPMRDRTTIHISIHEAATNDEAEAFFDDLGEWVGAWMEVHPAIRWEPFVWSHTESCDDSDHCHGPGSWVERKIAARALREAIPIVYEEMHSGSGVTATIHAINVSADEIEAGR